MGVHMLLAAQCPLSPCLSPGGELVQIVLFLYDAVHSCLRTLRFTAFRASSYSVKGPFWCFRVFDPTRFTSSSFLQAAAGFADQSQSVIDNSESAAARLKIIDFDRFQTLQSFFRCWLKQTETWDGPLTVASSADRHVALQLTVNVRLT